MPTHYIGKENEVLALDTFIKLTRATNSLIARLNQQGSMGDLTESQFGVLETVWHLGPLSQCELAGKLLKSGGNITLVVDNLEKRELVRREADKTDRRISRIVLTPAGKDLIQTVFPQHVNTITKELAVLSSEEQRLLGSLLRKLGKREIQPALIAGNEA